MLFVLATSKLSPGAHLGCTAMFSFPVPAGQPEDVEVTWRSLYACDNGWSGLQPGCFKRLDLPSSSGGNRWGQGWPSHCILNTRDLSWSAVAGDASELLVAVDWTSMLVRLRDQFAPYGFYLQHAPSIQRSVAGRCLTARRCSCCRGASYQEPPVASTNAWPHCQEGALQQATERALMCLNWIRPAVLRIRCCRQAMRAHGMPHALARQCQKTGHTNGHAQAANIAVVSIACEHVALQHGKQSSAGALARPQFILQHAPLCLVCHMHAKKTYLACAGSSSLTPSQRQWSTPCGATAWCRCLRAETSSMTPMDIPARSLCSTLPRGAACCANSKISCEHIRTLPHAPLTSAAQQSQQVTLRAALRRGDSITAYTLLDKGSGNEVVTGSVHYGEFDGIAWTVSVMMSA